MDHVGGNWGVVVSCAFCYGVGELVDSSVLDSESNSGGVGGVCFGDGGYLLCCAQLGQM